MEEGFLGLLYDEDISRRDQDFLQRCETIKQQGESARRGSLCVWLVCGEIHMQTGKMSYNILLLTTSRNTN